MTITNYSGPALTLSIDPTLDQLPPLSAFQFVLDGTTTIRRGVKCNEGNTASCWFESISEVRGRRQTPHFIVPLDRIPQAYLSRLTVTGIPPESYDAWTQSLPLCLKNFISQCPSPFSATLPPEENTAKRADVNQQGADAPLGKRRRHPTPQKSKVVRIRGRTVRIPPYHDMYSPPSSIEEYVIDRSSLPIPTPRFRAKKTVAPSDEPREADGSVSPGPQDTYTVPELTHMIDENRLVVHMLQEQLEKTQSKRRHLRRSVNIILETLKAQGFLQADD